MNESNVIGAILRFRDSMTDEGGTIQLHRKSCSQFGYTWWGWWQRQGEVVPYSVFVRLKNRAVTGDKINIFLFNSESKYAYEATCVDIHFHPGPRFPESSPRPEATPKYYRYNKYLAWFKFSNISEEPIPWDRILGQYSYVSIPLSQKPPRSDHRLHGKTIASILELRSHPRSIFFIGKSHNNDWQEEIQGEIQLQVFLCHSSVDKVIVRDLYRRLIESNGAPWLDEENLLPGQNWEFEIKRAVRESDVVLVCLSAESISKEGFVQKEISFALDVADEKPEGTIYILPARLNDCMVPSRLNRWQRVDMFCKKGYDKLIRSLNDRARQLGRAYLK